MSTATKRPNGQAEEVRGIVFNVQRFCCDDGPGIRTTVFLKGCPLRCAWCHNPESQLPKPQFSFDRERCIGCDACFDACPEQAISPEAPFPPSFCVQCGSCSDACPTGARQLVGRSMTVGEVMRDVLRDADFYAESRGGVTFSGGEPLSQGPFLLALLEECKRSGVNATVDTCGYAHWEDLKLVAETADLLLYDIKTIDDEKHKLATGVSNRRILRNLYLLAAMGAPVWIRVPLIPGFNDDDASLQGIGCTLAELPRRYPVWLLPYHEIGRHKRAHLGMPEADLYPQPSDDRVAACAEALRGYGLEVRTKKNL